MTSTETWTIQRLLNWVTEYLKSKGVDAPRLSAELLLSHVLGLKRIELYTQFGRVVEQEQLTQLHELVKHAAEHEPIAYLTGKREFYSLEFDSPRGALAEMLVLLFFFYGLRLRYRGFLVWSIFHFSGLCYRDFPDLDFPVWKLFHFSLLPPKFFFDPRLRPLLLFGIQACRVSHSLNTYIQVGTPRNTSKRSVNLNYPHSSHLVRIHGCRRMSQV